MGNKTLWRKILKPKKRILLIDADEYRTSIRSFMLSTHNYRVIPAATAEEAETFFAEVFPDVVIAEANFPGLAKLLQSLHERDAYVSQMVIAQKQQQCDIACDMFAVNPTAADLLERVRIIVAHKRGPRTAVSDVSAFRASLQRMTA
jgi:two-component system, OmpR family, response regulator CpxR